MKSDTPIPSRSHSHPYTDENHEHEPGGPEDAPWPDLP